MSNRSVLKLALASGLLLLLGLTSYDSLGQSAPGAPPQTAVARIWHGRTHAAQADEYYSYLEEAGIRKIRGIAGNLGVQVFRRTTNDVTDFTVTSYWESKEAIQNFAGAEIEKTHNLPRDPEYLLELEPTVTHYDVVLNEWKR